MEHKDFSVTRDLLKKAGELGSEWGRNSRSLRRHGNRQGHRRRHRRSHRKVRRLRHHLGRPHRHRHACRMVYFGTEEQKKKYLPRLAAGEIVGAYALVGSVIRLRRAELPLARGRFVRWQALHSQRREDVDHQCRLRRPVHRLRESRRRKVHRISGRDATFPDSPSARKNTRWAFADRPPARSF